MSIKTPRIDKIEQEVYSNEIEVAKIDAPFTQIKNEQDQSRQIADLANNMKTSFGVERIMFDKLSLSDRESGSNGETVYKTNDDRVRFVGGWDYIAPSVGMMFQSTTSNSFVEITFFGTGLNYLGKITGDASDVRASIDGGVEGGNTGPSTSASGVLNNRNYKTNQAISIVSNLPLNKHTVKLRLDSGFFLIYGIEILNESAQLVTNAGKPRADSLNRELLAPVLSNYNSDFDSSSDAIGTKGGRVLVYQAVDGSIKKRFKAVDVTPLYLGATDHSNEEVVRKINWREFGVNRSDDFSTLAGSTSNRGFTLDDGTTTLVGNNIVYSSGNGIQLNAANAFVALTFVGTGLGIFALSKIATGTDPISATVDGINVGLLDGITASNKDKVTDICSGLPYGTHTVKINRDSFISGTNFFLNDFIIYQPKKPVLESIDIELADYNIMADFDDSNIGAGSTSGARQIDGVIVKNCLREIVYVGTWSVGSLNPIRETSGVQIFTTVNGSSLEYTFFGNDIVVNLDGASSNMTFNVEIDGVLNDTGVGITSTLSNNGAGVYGLTTPDIGQAFLSFKNIGVGKHIIKLTKVSGGTMELVNFYIGVPIHFQDTMKVGSLSLQDKRNAIDVTEISKNRIDLSKAKAWCFYDQINNRIISSYNISSVLNVTTGTHIVYFKRPFKDDKYFGVGGNNNSQTRIVGVSKRRPSSARIFNNLSTTGSLENSSFVGIVFFGELENEEDIDLGDL